MDRNAFLAIALSLAVLILWSQLTAPPPGSQPEPEPTGREAPGAPAGAHRDPPGETPTPTPTQRARAPELPHKPTAPSPEAPERVPPLVEPGKRAPAAATAAAGEGELKERRIEIERGLYTVELSSRGAGIVRWTLQEFREAPRPDAPLVELTTGEPPWATALVTPFTELGIGDLATAHFDVVSEGPESVVFELRREGITVRKTYRFQEGYAFRLLVEVENRSQGPVPPRFQVDIPAHVREGVDFRELALAVLEDGGTVSRPVQGLGRAGFFDFFTGAEPGLYEDFLGEIDWAGVQTTYFLSAVRPDKPSEAGVRLLAAVPGEAGVAQLFFNEISLSPGQSAARELRGYLGPKDMDRLESFGGDTVHAVDLGWSWIEPLTVFFSWLLTALYEIVPNYGLAIIVLTILVRLVTTPLTLKQMKSMERMRALAPKLKELQEKHKDDRQKQSEETMKLYRSEGVNPLGGCLPMLLQFPVFIGLFYALRSTIHLRQSPFFGWIDDLSAPETLFEIPGLGIPLRVLPLVMGGSMVIQQKLTPMQMDPAQAKMMMTLMPIMMTVVFYQFPSGLVLYWLVSNLLAIGHQLVVGRRMKTGAAG